MKISKKCMYFFFQSNCEDIAEVEQNRNKAVIYSVLENVFLMKGMNRHIKGMTLLCTG